MSWKDVAKTAAAMGLKLVGGSLGGPAGSAIGSKLAENLGLAANAPPDQVEQALVTASPDALVKIRELEGEIERANIEAGVKHHEIESDDLSTVNETMRVEANQGHKWAGAWRPFWGFASAITFFVAVVGIIVLAGYAIYKKDHQLLVYVPQLTGELTFLFGVPGAILGVASWHRGKMQRIQAGESLNK